MKTKILVAGLACLSMLAAAQQSEEKVEQPVSHEVKTPRDAASGQASGRKADHTAASDASAGTARETGSGMPTGKTTATDDWQSQATTTSGDPHMKNVSTGDTNGDQTMVRESPTRASSGLRESPTKASTGKTSVTAGDVDGDGRADKTAASDGVKSPRDAATGQASGKRQHAPVKVTKEVESSAPQK
jgi:hypothetical protein